MNIQIKIPLCCGEMKEGEPPILLLLLSFLSSSDGSGRCLSYSLLPKKIWEKMGIGSKNMGEFLFPERGSKGEKEEEGIWGRRGKEGFIEVGN